jgi:signal transduction histidine kinase
MERNAMRNLAPEVDEQAADEWRDRIHDLKNPLSAILANCQYLMVHGELNEMNQEVVGDIAASAKALRALIDGSLQNATLGKSAAGRAKK